MNIPQEKPGLCLLTHILANFGLVGNGRLYILGLTANGIQAEKWYTL
jgi:hypothetical protein